MGSWAPPWTDVIKTVVSLSTGLALGSAGAGSHSGRKRHRTVESSGQQLPKECRPSSDQHAAPAEPLASTQLHQPSPPQLSGLDWLLSPRSHDKRASHRGGGRGVVCVGMVVGVAVVVTVCLDHMSVHATKRPAPNSGGPCPCGHDPPPPSSLALFSFRRRTGRESTTGSEYHLHVEMWEIVQARADAEHVSKVEQAIAQRHTVHDAQHHGPAAKKKEHRINAYKPPKPVMHMPLSMSTESAATTSLSSCPSGPYIPTKMQSILRTTRGGGGERERRGGGGTDCAITKTCLTMSRHTCKLIK